MKISIVMATYNGAQFIQEQLQSFDDQTRKTEELIVSDDSSVDDTVSIIHEFAKTASFKVELYDNESTSGYCGNFNTALIKAIGDFVFLSDQDDVWFEDKLSKVEQVFAENPDKYLIIHDLAYCDKALKPIGQTKLERLRSIGASDRSYVTGMATAIRREFLNVCLPIPNNPLMTHDLWLHECAHALDIKKVIPDVLAWYRRHAQNVTNNSVINSAKKTNFFSFIKKQNIEKIKSHVERRVVLMEELINWSHRDDVIRFCLNELGIDNNDLEIIHNKINVEQTFTKRRLELYSCKRLMRIMLAIKLYFEGGYAGFMGMKSLLKDILL